jgi:tape measure domain-containing protein
MATISTNDIKIRYDIDLSKLQQATEAFDRITAEERQLLAELAKLKRQFDDVGGAGKAAPEKMIPPTKAAAGSIADLESKVRKLNSEVKNTNIANADYAGKVKQLKAAQDELKKATDNLNSSLKNVKETTQQAGGGMSQFQAIAGKAGAALAGIFAASKIIEFGQAVVETTIKFESMQKAIDFASGSAEMGNKNFEFIRETAQKLGLDLRGAVEGYKTFASASNLAGQSSQETNRQFAAVAKAAQVMGLSAEDTKGAFLALGQMMSKGNVQAEELRGQLGERLVGAFGIAAKAMGVTTGELNKMLQKGQVLASDFLPKFATELENTFGKGNEQVTTLAASQNRFNSSIDQLILAIGNKLNPFLKGAYDLAAGIAANLAKAGGETSAERQAKFNAEAVAQKRIETELTRETIKLDQQRIVKITAANLDDIRKKIALNQLLGIEGRIEAQMLKVSEARISAAGTMSSRLQMNLTKQENELKILQAMEEQYSKIAGVIINTPVLASPEDVKEKAKRDKEEYERRLKLLQLERELSSIINKIRYDNKIDLLREEFKAEDKFLKDVYKLQVQYAALGVEAAKDGIEKTRLEKELNRVQTIRDLKSETQDVLDAIKKQREENAKFEAEKTKAQEERTSKRQKVNFEIEQLEIDLLEKLDELDKKFAKERDDRKKKELDERIEEVQKGIELAQTLSDGSFKLFQARINNEMALNEKRYEQEIRLADGNQQKIDEINQRREEKERELKMKAWKAEQTAAVARVIFETASIVAKWSSSPVTLPLAALTLFNQAAQIGFIMAQPVPEFAEGTKGKPFKGGKAIVGERGVEKVVTESGKVYFTPASATLVDLPKGSQVIPNHALSRQELFLANHYANRNSSSGSPVVGEIRELGSILKSLPITQLSMDERGFEKFIRTPRRTTKILNNRFRTDS